MLAGLARVDVTVWEPGVTLLGWGLPHQQARRVAEPLHARALVLRDPDTGAVAAFVTVELMAVPRGLWLEVGHALATRHPALGLDATNLTLAATHTHSGPSGFAHDFWLQLNARGFWPGVHDPLVDGIVDAVARAHADLGPARLVLATGEVPREAGVAFNRSWWAYARNPEVAPVPHARRDEAVHREMTLVRVERPDGRVVGLVDWFGLHNTCVHGDHDALHPDHKGLAATTLEARHGLVALFAQECCGDVSPNHRDDPRRGHTVGVHDDDHASARHVADAQVAVAEALLAAPGEVLDGPLQVVTAFVDLADAPARPAHTIDGRPHRTRPGVLGLSMAEGTAEGKGPLWPARRALAALHALRRAADRARATPRHDPMIPLVDLSGAPSARLLGLIPLRHVPPVDPVLRWVRAQVRAGRADGPWIPPVQALQLLRIGGLLVAAVPSEPTTVAGRRLRAALRAAAPDGVRHVVVSPYANGYTGYLTTAEEYQVQHYEAAYTVFGPHQLAAVTTALEDLAGQLGRERVVGVAPARRPREALLALAYGQPWGV